MATRVVVVHKAMANAAVVARAAPVEPMQAVSQTRRPQAALRVAAARVGPKGVGVQTGIVLMRLAMGGVGLRSRTL